MSPLTERNRKNSQKSSGPRTATGKARSSQNALTNGLYAISAKLPSEDQELYLAHSAAFIADLNPEGAAQQALVEIVSDNTWRLRRVRVLLEAQTNLLIRLVDSADDLGFHSFIKMQATASRALETLGRCEQRMLNGMAKALKQLKELQHEAVQESAQSEPAEPESGFVPTPQTRTAAAGANAPQSEPESTPETPLTPARDSFDDQVMDEKVAA
jgi:hypothetical protein